MKATTLQYGIRKCLGPLMIFVISLVGIGATAQEITRAEPLPGASVSGPVQAVEEDRQTLIVEGRRFSLAPRVNIDGVELSREQVISRLSEGGEVTLYRENINQRVIERIHTNLE